MLTSGAPTVNHKRIQKYTNCEPKGEASVSRRRRTFSRLLAHPNQKLPTHILVFRPNGSIRITAHYSCRVAKRRAQAPVFVLQGPEWWVRRCQGHWYLTNRFSCCQFQACESVFGCTLVPQRLQCEFVEAAPPLPTQQNRTMMFLLKSTLCHFHCLCSGSVVKADMVLFGLRVLLCARNLR